MPIKFILPSGEPPEGEQAYEQAPEKTGGGAGEYAVTFDDDPFEIEIPALAFEPHPLKVLKYGNLALAMKSEQPMLATFEIYKDSGSPSCELEVKTLLSKYTFKISKDFLEDAKSMSSIRNELVEAVVDAVAEDLAAIFHKYLDAVS